MTVAEKIRPLHSSDLVTIRGWMMADPNAPAWSDAELATMVAAGPQGARERRGWAAVDDAGAMAGFVVATALHLPQAPAECELEFLLVAPERRGRGIGRKLLEHVLAWAKQQGAGEMWLEVRASNVAAQRLYESCGFERIGVRPGYYDDPTEDGVQMRRPI